MNVLVPEFSTGQSVSSCPKTRLEANLRESATYPSLVMSDEAFEVPEWLPAFIAALSHTQQADGGHECCSVTRIVLCKAQWRHLSLLSPHQADLVLWIESYRLVPDSHYGWTDESIAMLSVTGIAVRLGR